MHGGHVEFGRVRAVRRYGWQIGGLGVAAMAVVGLGMLAFGCGSGAQPPPHAVSPSASPSVRASATVDPRVAEVEAAARRYVQALQESAKSGNPTPVNNLVVPGSQAAGNAGVASSFSKDNHYAFIASRVDFGSVVAAVNQDTATAKITYALYGHTADWPSLAPRESDHETASFDLSLELDLRGSQWLVSRSS
jgi:hypothetical protein